MKKIWILFALLANCLMLLAQSGDIETVKKNICESYFRVLNHDPRVRQRADEIVKRTANVDLMIRELQEGVNPGMVKQYLSSLRSDGSWADLNYQDLSRSGWHPSVHAERLSLLAKAYRDRNGEYFQHKQLGEALHRGMKYWFDGGFKCRNWWYNQIGVPKMLGVVFLLMESEMSADEKAKAIDYMKNARLGMTGQNSVWLAENVLIRALLEQNDTLFIQARNTILKELKVNETGEGIRPDMSFHQHGAQLQFGNYGLAFANTMAYWARIFSDTEYALHEEQLVALRNYLLGGMQWIVWKGYMDISSCGRQLFWDALDGKTFSLGKAIQNMMVADPVCASQYERLYAEHIAVSKPGNSFKGNIYFPYSDFGVHRTADWCATIKMSSNRVIGSEIVNSENLSGYYLGDGALYIYRNGGEYRDIFPAWDWTKLPGVTCSDDQHVFGKGSVFRNQSDFVGGLSDGNISVIGLALNKNGVTACKSYFFTGDAIVCMGNEIRSNLPFEVTTSVEQCLQQGSVQEWKGRDGQKVFCHNGTAYVFPGGQNVLYTAGVQPGSWGKVAQFGDSLFVEKEIFKLWVSHGKTPDGGGYRYSVIPGIEEKNWEKTVQHLPVGMISENGNVHWLRKDNSWLMAFFGSATVDMQGAENMRLGLEEPGFVMLNKTGKTWGIQLVEPTGLKDKMNIRVSKKWRGEGYVYDKEKDETVIPVEIPKGHGGKSVFIKLVK